MDAKTREIRDKRDIREEKKEEKSFLVHVCQCAGRALSYVYVYLYVVCIHIPLRVHRALKVFYTNGRA